MTLERAKQIIQENFGDKYDVVFSLDESVRIAELEAQLKEARDVLSGLIEWNDHEKGIPLTWVVERARAALAVHEVKREEAK